MSPVKQICGLKPFGLFGATRKHDIHTGVDFYCQEGEEVKCLYDGTVVDIFQFTGCAVGSPWWNDTQAVVVENLTTGLTFVYGELSPAVRVGEYVNAGQVLGHVLPVLKEDKGLTPTAMLHLEVWRNEGYLKNYTWDLNTPKPDGLIDPIQVLSGWLVKTEMGYMLLSYKGTYLKWFDMAANSKAYCMEQGIAPTYITMKSPLALKEEYKRATGRGIW